MAAAAALTRIDVGRVAASGVVDLGAESTSGYRFVSAGRWTRRQNEIAPVIAAFSVGS